MTATACPFCCMTEAASAESFLQLLDSAPLGIFRTSIEGRVIYANPTLLGILGYSSLAELIREVPDIAALYADPQERQRLRARLLAGETLEGLRVRLRRRSGQPLSIDFWAQAVKSPDGLPCCIQGFVEDATHRVLATDALGACEQRYQDLFDSSPIGIFQTGRDGTFFTVNPALAATLGYDSPQELLRLVPNARGLYPNPAVRDRIFEREMARPGPFTVETVLLKKDGAPILARLRGRFVRDAAGEVTRLEGFLEDVSCSVRRVRELEQGERFYRGLLESLREGVWEVDENLRYTYVSPGLCNLLGYSRDELLGRTPFDLFVEEEAEELRLLFEPIHAARRPFSFMKNRNRRKDGGTVLLESNGVPFFDDSERFAGYRGIDRDITVREEEDQRLRHTVEELKERIGRLNGALDRARADLDQARRELAVRQDRLTQVDAELLEANRAVTLMARRAEQSGQDQRLRITLGIREKVLPLLETLLEDADSKSRDSGLQLLRSYLRDFCAPTASPEWLPETLTPTELKVAALIREGQSTAAIARQLNVSVATVKTHRKNLRRKLQLGNRSIKLEKFLQAKL